MCVYSPYVCCIVLTCNMDFPWKNFLNEDQAVLVESVHIQVIVASTLFPWHPGTGTDVPPFKLKVFRVVWDCLHRCWAEGIFLPALAHRFWKLTLQVRNSCNCS